MNETNIPPMTLPAVWYTDPAVLQQERDQIFYREWLFVGHLCEFATAGAYVTRQIMRQNIFVIRGADGELRAFYNVCSHRAHELLVGKGTAETVVCPYHNWSYWTDGRLRTANNAKHVAGFDKDRFCLTPIRVATCGPLVFVNLDAQAPDLSDVVGDLAAEIGREYPDFDHAEMTFIDESAWSVEANWKVDLENFLECYHCAPVHTEFCDVFQVKTQRADLRGHYVFHYADAMPTGRAGYPYDPSIYP